MSDAFSIFVHLFYRFRFQHYVIFLTYFLLHLSLGYIHLRDFVDLSSILYLFNLPYYKCFLFKSEQVFIFSSVMLFYPFQFVEKFNCLNGLIVTQRYTVENQRYLSSSL